MEAAAAQAAPVVQGVPVARAKLLFMAALLRERAGLWDAAETPPPPPTAPAPAPAPAPKAAPPAAAAAAASSPSSPVPVEWRQNAQYVALILQVPGVIKASVDAKFQARAVEMTLRSSPLTPGGAEQAHTLSLKLAGAVDVDGCRYDAADNNMMVVLKKAAEGAEWPALEEEGGGLERSLGLREFDANLVIAVVQDRARRGESTEDITGPMSVFADQKRTPLKSNVRAVLAGTAIGLAVGFAILFVRWLTG